MLGISTIFLLVHIFAMHELKNHWMHDIRFASISSLGIRFSYQIVLHRIIQVKYLRHVFKSLYILNNLSTNCFLKISFRKFISHSLYLCMTFAEFFYFSKYNIFAKYISTQVKINKLRKFTENSFSCSLNLHSIKSFEWIIMNIPLPFVEINH